MGGEKTTTCQKQLKVKSADSTKDRTFRKYGNKHTDTHKLTHIYKEMCER